MTCPGLQLDRFIETFTPRINDTSIVYATEAFVNTTVSNYINTLSSVTVDISEGLSITSTITGTNRTVIDVGLSAILNDIQNVDTTGVSNGDYLQYIGNEWVPGPGLSIASMNFLQLTDVDETTIPSGTSTFFITNQGGSLVFTENDYISTIAQGPGTDVSKPDSNQALISLDANNLTLINSTDDTPSQFDFVIYSGSDSTTKKAPIGQIPASNFENFSTSATEAALGSLVVTNVPAANNFLTYSTSTYQLTLDSTSFLTGPGGILPINRGGTSATTALEARDNLGVSINRDVMGVSSPIFYGTMTGENIILDDAPYAYLNFGTSLGSDGIGIRSDGASIIEVGVDGTWTSLVGTSIGDLSDVDFSLPGTSEILIFNGTSFRGVSLSGAIIMDYNGFTTFTDNGISINQIEFVPVGTPVPTQGDFEALVGISGISPSTLIEQFDENILRVEAANDLFTNQVLYADSNSGISTIKSTVTPATGGFLYQDTSATAPAWSSITEGIEQGISTLTVTDIPDYQIPVVYTSGTSEVYQYPVDSFNDLITGSTSINGLDVESGGGYIRLNVNNLDEDTADHNYTMVAVGPSVVLSGSSVAVKKSFNNLIKESLPPFSGLSVTSNSTSGYLQISIPIGTSVSVPPATTIIGTSGALIYLTDQGSGPGTCYLAVSNGLNWYGAQLELLS